MIYLDNAASTRIHEDVLKLMMPYLREQYGNPSSIHRHGRMARKAVRKARAQAASLINADPSEIIFTSGGTESNNMAILGAAGAAPGTVITSSIEHDAILEPCRRLEETGFDVLYLPASSSGMIRADDLGRMITDDTRLVSVMLANNEVGTIQPVAELARICRAKSIPFHTDAVQAAGKIPVDVRALGVDLLSFSSHKINGPKGAGALYVRRGTRSRPLMLGGGQEDGMRSGTENVAGVVGFGAACGIAQDSLDTRASHMRHLRDLLTGMILDCIPAVSVNGDPSHRLPNSIHLTFLGVNGEDLIIKLDENGIAASTGSACSVHTQKESHVLRAMGFSREQITGSLRLTLGIYSTRQEMLRTVDVLKDVIRELRAVSPFWTKYVRQYET